jgi:hypothetical protein
MRSAIALRSTPKTARCVLSFIVSKVASMLGILTVISECFIGLWIVVILAVVVFSIIGGRISLVGLLVEPLTNAQAPLTRPQLLLSTIAAAAAYASIAIAKLGSAHDLPDAPLWITAVFAGSHSLYLGGRGISALLTKSLGGFG